MRSICKSRELAGTVLLLLCDILGFFPAKPESCIQSSSLMKYLSLCKCASRKLRQVQEKTGSSSNELGDCTVEVLDISSLGKVKAFVLVTVQILCQEEGNRSGQGERAARRHQKEMAGLSGSLQRGMRIRRKQAGLSSFKPRRQRAC